MQHNLVVLREAKKKRVLSSCLGAIPASLLVGKRNRKQSLQNLKINWIRGLLELQSTKRSNSEQSENFIKSQVDWAVRHGYTAYLIRLYYSTVLPLLKIKMETPDFTTWMHPVSLLSLSCKLGHADIVRFLLKKTGTQLEGDEFIFAAVGDHSGMYSFYLSTQPPPTTPCYEGVLRVLIEHVPDRVHDQMDSGIMPGATPLHMACLRDNLEVAKLLIEA